MRHGSVIATFTMAIMVMVWLASLLRVGDVAVVPTDTETEEKRIPAPLNASLGFGKLYYISLPSYASRYLVLICRRTDRQDHMSLAFYVSELTPAEVRKNFTQGLMDSWSLV